MVIDRRPSRYPRRGPSCLTVLLIIVAAVAGSFLFTNRQQVIEAIVPTPTPEPTRDAPSYFLSAQLYERDGEYEKAITNYQNAIQLDPENTSYYVDLIELLTRTGDAEGALYWAELVSVAAPNDDKVLTAAAAAYLINGDRLAEIGKRNDALEQYQRAIDTARRANNINPNNAEAYAYEAGALIQQDIENFPAAQELVDTAFAITPDNAIVRYYRGSVLEAQGYYPQAIEEYATAMELAPGYTAPAMALAYTYFYTDNRQRAIVTLRDLISENPDDAAANDALGWMYFLAGQYADAEAYLEDAVALDEEMTRAHAHLGSAYFKNFNYDLAIPSLERAIKDYEEDVAAGVDLTNTTALYYNYLAFAYYRVDPTLCYTKREPYQYTAEQLFQRVLESPLEGIRIENAQIGLEDCRQAALETGQ